MTEYVPKVGAPKGGRVHWLAIILPRIVGKNYELHFKYLCKRGRHNYYLRFKSRDRWDEYVIMRTSEKCYHVTYFDKPSLTFDRVTCKKAEYVIDYILYRLPLKLAQEKEFEDARKAEKGKRKPQNGGTSETMRKTQLLRSDVAL